MQNSRKIKALSKVPERDRLVTTGYVREMLGGVSKPTIKRWRDKFSFPRPALQIGIVHYYRLVDVKEWVAKNAPLTA